MPESIAFLVGLSFVWIDDDTVTVRVRSKGLYQGTPLKVCSGILHRPLTDSHENAGGIMPVCEPVSEWEVS